MTEKNELFILNRSKSSHLSALEQQNFSNAQDAIKNTHEAAELASAFPDWDLRPTAILVKRRRSKKYE